LFQHNSMLAIWWLTTVCRNISCQQIWHTYVQESIQRVAKASDQPLELSDELPIAEVTKHAFISFGEEGVIRSAEDHFCSEYTHTFKQTADIILVTILLL